MSAAPLAGKRLTEMRLVVNVWQSTRNEHVLLAILGQAAEATKSARARAVERKRSSHLAVRAVSPVVPQLDSRTNLLGAA